MTEMEFSENLQKMSDFYNKDFNVEEKKVWWEGLKDLPVNDFKLMIQAIYLAWDKLPKWSEIQPLLRNTKERRRRIEAEMEQPKQEKEKVNCKICKNAGVVPYIRDIDGVRTQYFAICSCEHADKIPMDLRKRLRPVSQLYI